MTGNQITQDGIDLVKRFEGCKLTAYVCPAGRLTIGYGHTGDDVATGDAITQDEAEKRLADDLARAGRAVLSLVSVPLNDNQFSALASFVFNLGGGRLFKSTLRSNLNKGDYRGAADEFPRWNHCNGVVMAGLTARRSAERELFLKPVEA